MIPPELKKHAGEAEAKQTGSAARMECHHFRTEIGSEGFGSRLLLSASALVAYTPVYACDLTMRCYMKRSDWTDRTL